MNVSGVKKSIQYSDVDLNASNEYKTEDIRD